MYFRNTSLFESWTEDLVANQMRLLTAIADGIHEGLSSAEVIWEENKAVRNIPTSCINFDRLFVNCQKMVKFDS